MTQPAHLRVVGATDGNEGLDPLGQGNPAAIFIPIDLLEDEPLLDRTVWIGLLLALVINSGVASLVWFRVVDEPEEIPQTVEFALVEPPPPPEPEPEPEPEPPKVVDFEQAQEPIPTETAPESEPPAEPPPPIFGVSMSSTVAPGDGAFAVRVGNTLMKEPEPEVTDPSEVRPLPKVSFQRLDEPPRIIRDFRAPYPEGPRDEGYEGTVILKLTIDETGKVSEAKVVRGVHPELDAAAQAAALRFVFKPGKSGGESVITTNYVYRYTWLIED